MMRKMCKTIVYCICIICMELACTSKAAFEPVPRNPLAGSRQVFPGASSIMSGAISGQVPSEALDYLQYANEDLTRLLDVGACISSAGDTSISYVPLLDGASPIGAMCQDAYAMKVVLFDLQLIELKSVDPVGGSFRAELQMILHWVDSIISGSDGTKFTDDCSFLCDTNSPRPLCCDKVWVPPLNLPGCDLNQVRSSTPTPYIYTQFGGSLSYDDCFKKENEGACIWRRLWNLNIDATCSSQMDFHDFPFDVQSLYIDILNPYASRTWFQLTKGFLQDNIGEDIINLNLSPDKNIPGWYVNELEVSSRCGASENWKQTFLTQDIILKDLNGSYETQQREIDDTLNPETLICSNISSSKYDNTDFRSPTDYGLYQVANDNYEERVHSTLEAYRQCIQISDKNKNFYWNMSLYNDTTTFPKLTEFEDFDTSSGNINRSFSILDLVKNINITKVSFECAILAIANLTTPGIRVTILLQRYRMFYAVKIILPTIACVIFSFATFGLQPHKLADRLTVVVPSAIALTALQGLVVSTDIPPLAYIARSTYIFLISYLVQILIAFESIFVSRLHSRWISNWFTRKCRPKLFTRRQGGNTKSSQSILPISTNNGSIEHPTIDTMPNEEKEKPNIRNNEEKEKPNIRNNEDPKAQTSDARILDFIALCFFAIGYIIAILVCIVHPWLNSLNSKGDVFNSNSNAIFTLWTQSSN